MPNVGQSASSTPQILRGYILSNQDGEDGINSNDYEDISYDEQSLEEPSPSDLNKNHEDYEYFLLDQEPSTSSSPNSTTTIIARIKESRITSSKGKKHVNAAIIPATSEKYCSIGMFSSRN